MAENDDSSKTDKEGLEAAEEEIDPEPDPGLGPASNQDAEVVEESNEETSTKEGDDK